ncbi:MAG: hypothetical protein Q7N50_02410 [Armatimonadota bacterium]|nr:hypothetical protein [Armatimonadota bacterium]
MARALFTVLLVVAFTVCGASVYAVSENTSSGANPQSESDQEILRLLSPKVTYETRRKTVQTILADLTNATGVQLRIGPSLSAWRVGESRISVFAKDTPLINLMNSIARSMKFRWTRKNNDGVWVFSLFEDTKAEEDMRREVEALKLEDVKKRREHMDKYLSLGELSSQDLAKIKETNPEFYLYAQFDIPKSLKSLLKEVPELYDAWVAGEDVKLSVANLPAQAQDAFINLAESLYRHSEAIYPSPKFKSLKPSQDIAIYSTIHINEPSTFNRLGWISLAGNDPRDVSDRNRMLGECLFLDDPDDKAGFIRSKAYLRAYEEKRPAKDVMLEMKQELSEARKADEARHARHDYYEEPLIEHPDDPALSKPVKLNAKKHEFDDCFAALAEGSRLAVVAADYQPDEYTDGFTDWRDILDFGLEASLQKVLDKFALGGRYNWEVHGHVIEFRRREWYKERQAMIPQAWINKWRKTLITTGTLDITDLAEIASLKDSQIYYIYGDHLLGMGRGGDGCEQPGCEEFLAGVIYGDKEFLKVYHLLTPRQRKLVFTRGGLDLGGMEPNQYKAFERLLIDRNGAYVMDSGAQLLLTATRAQKGKRYEYVFTVKTSADLPPVMWQIKTPKYENPDKKKS